MPDQLPRTTPMDEFGMRIDTSMKLCTKSRCWKQASSGKPAGSVERVPILTTPPAAGGTGRAGLRDAANRGLEPSHGEVACRNCSLVRCRCSRLKSRHRRHPDANPLIEQGPQCRMSALKAGLNASEALPHGLRRQKQGLRHALPRLDELVLTTEYTDAAHAVTTSPPTGLRTHLSSKHGRPKYNCLRLSGQRIVVFRGPYSNAACNSLP